MSSHSTSLEPKSQLTIILALGRKHKKKENSQSKIKKKRKRKERKFPIKDWKKTEEIGRKVFRPDDIWTIQELSSNKQKEKRKETTNQSGPLPLIANQNPVRWWLVRLALKKTEKEKAKKLKSQNSHQKNPFPRKVLLIHDHTCNLWFDGKWFAKSSHNISMVRN